MKYKSVIVSWRDITTKNWWNDQDEIDSYIMDLDENIVHQVGFLYEEDDHQICLLNSYFSGQDLLGDLTKIPKGCVLEIKKL